MAHLSPELSSALETAISERHLDAVAEQIIGNSAECYAMVVDGADDYSSVGNTRFGGDPDLPDSFDWPTDPNGTDPRYSNFIAQINFADFPPLSSGNPLPTSGILYVFVRSMDSAAEPVVLDAMFFDGDRSSLTRRVSPDEESLCDEYLVELSPQRIRAVPATSIASYRKQFRNYVEQHTEEVDGDDGEMRRIYLQSDLAKDGQIGQMLGFANAGDERENLYRQLVLARMGKRKLVYNDYWDSMEEYEAYIEEWRDDKQLMEMYRGMRDGVIWLTSNSQIIADAVGDWRLLFRLDSNFYMDLNINDADPLYVFIRNEDLKRKDFSDLAGEVTQG